MRCGQRDNDFTVCTHHWIQCLSVKDGWGDGSSFPYLCTKKPQDPLEGSEGLNASPRAPHPPGKPIQYAFIRLMYAGNRRRRFWPWISHRKPRNQSDSNLVLLSERGVDTVGHDRALRVWMGRRGGSTRFCDRGQGPFLSSHCYQTRHSIGSSNLTLSQRDAAQ